MSTISIKSFPAYKLTEARDALSKAHARLVHSAAKTGQSAGAAPQIIVVETRLLTRCTERCGTPDGTMGHTGGPCTTPRCEGNLVTGQVCDLEVTVERPALAGWDFLAVVEPLGEANLLRQVPGADVADGELLAYRTGDIVCDHCKAKRDRKETFIVRADGTDEAVALGTYRQVGRNCLGTFLGGKSPAAIVASLAYEKMIRDLGDEDGGGSGGGRGPLVYVPMEFMAWVASSVRGKGWTPKSAASDERMSTASHVSYLLNPPFDPRCRADWKAARETFMPTEADTARGAAALEWARNLPEKSDYERNVRLVAIQEVVLEKHTGILASAISGYLKSLGERTRKETVATAPSEHVGTPGDKKRGFGRVVLERVASFESQYGTTFVHTFRDTSGNAIVWKTKATMGDTGDAYTLIGNVKAHSEFRGEKQTEVIRCKVVPAGAFALAGAEAA